MKEAGKTRASDPRGHQKKSKFYSKSKGKQKSLDKGVGDLLIKVTLIAM